MLTPKNIDALLDLLLLSNADKKSERVEASPSIYTSFDQDIDFVNRSAATD